MARIFHMILAAAVLALPGSGAGVPSTVVTHGVVVGDVTALSAVLWARADHAGALAVRLSPAPSRRVERLRFRAADDFTAQLRLTGLRPDTAYSYRVGSARGTFRTAPRAVDARPVRLAFGGDVAGQNVCRDAREGFPIMETIRRFRPRRLRRPRRHDLRRQRLRPRGRYGNAQVPGRARGRPRDAPGALALQPRRRRLAAAARTSYVGVWDDHEVVNDFGPVSDTGQRRPTRPASTCSRSACRPSSTTRRSRPAANTPARLYRSLRWGRHMELFVLDTRQYRDANGAADSADPPEDDARASSSSRG